MRLSAAGMPTASSSSSARWRAAWALTLSWWRIVSTNWSPTVNRGCRLVSGSWKIAPISLPRKRWRALGGRLSMRLPARWISPPPSRPGGSSRPITAMPVSDLPAPDSPTMPRISPGWMSKLMSRVATRTPWRVGNSTDRPRTDRVGAVLAAAGGCVELGTRAIMTDSLRDADSWRKKSARPADAPRCGQGSGPPARRTASAPALAPGAHRSRGSARPP
ncbi:Uncharacterised protein [Achromobacter aegrifaciens]|uniref:Uncharacterized protein n=1 Tax=Achromobacter aegrifaciens TaxID=1287736 RepID=A0AAD2IW23_ACHAE|nr:Uncharacterised protein [Achromobacter aegrifaciens]